MHICKIYVTLYKDFTASSLSPRDKSCSLPGIKVLRITDGGNVICFKESLSSPTEICSVPLCLKRKSNNNSTSEYFLIFQLFILKTPCEAS